ILPRDDIVDGQEVSRGQPIATIGSFSGVGPHLHFEIRTTMNPDGDWYPTDIDCDGDGKGDGYYPSLSAVLAAGFVDPVEFIDARRPFEILKPTQSAPANAGPKDNPNKIEVEVQIGIHGLNSNDFNVQIGGKNSSIVSVVELSDEYVLEVMPPTQDTNDLYDLTVSVGSASDTEIDAVQYGVSNADVPLVIDRSGSMSGSKIVDARNAAKQFVDLMNNGDQVGVVSFSGDARVDFPLTLITSSNIKEQAKSAIDLLYASGVTSIGDGLQAGQDELNNRGDATHSWAIVLLSDGLENTPAYVADVLPGIPDKTDVYTIGLGTYVDEDLMQNIATETGGEYYYSPSPDQLQEIYSLIGGRIAGEQTITSKSGTVNGGETKIETTIIDFLISLVRFLVSWSGSDIDLTLTDPNGLVIDPNVASTDPNISFTSGSTYEYYTIESPTSGEWRMNIKGVDTPLGGEDYTARVTGKSDLTLSPYFDKDRYETGQLITVLASVSDGSGPITGASVEVVVQAPSQSLSAWKSVNGDTVPTKPLRESVSTLKSLYKGSLNLKSPGQQSSSSPVFYLYDDGAHGDGQANDGVYGNLYTNTSDSGSYIFNFEASGTTTGGSSFTRITTRSLFVAPAAATGSISGTISYSGSQVGPVYIQAWQGDPTMYGNPDYLTSISSPGPYILSNLPDSGYYLTSYMDSNENGIRDENEPRAVYGLPHMPSTVIVSGGNQISGIDITIVEGVISYPNPCYPNRGQIIKIANLPLNSKVHIYTISGELVRTLDDVSEISIGGSSTTAFWDCKNDAGEEVARGIYIYLGTDDIGNKRTGKIAIIK
ncbi:VWA domain-containing protein, partial [Candidatus Aerophobetes bacterium]